MESQPYQTSFSLVIFNAGSRIAWSIFILTAGSEIGVRNIASIRMALLTKRTADMPITHEIMDLHVTNYDSRLKTTKTQGKLKM